jgi:leader peptidase (prepilin peptidase)/N-methyltransferase
MELLDRAASLGTTGWMLLVVAPFVGSFLGVVIRRLPEGRPLVAARSRCERCGVVLAARDLVPLISWFVLHGRCRHCGHPVGQFYPGIELASLAVAATATAVHGPESAWLDCLLGWCLLALGWIDLRTGLLPDVLDLPLLVLGLLVAEAFEPDELADRAVAAAIGYIALRAISWIYRRLRGRDGLGQGDAKLFAAGGAWLGSAALPLVMLLAAVAALLAAGSLALGGTKLRAHTALPFGPFLAAAIWILWLSRQVSL